MMSGDTDPHSVCEKRFRSRVNPGGRFGRLHGVTLAENHRTEGRGVDTTSKGSRVDVEPVAQLPEVVSFPAIFRTEYRRLVAIAWGLTGSRETAEDIAQEALLSLHRRLERGEVIENPAAYVRRSCSNLSVSWVRRRMAEARALLRIGAVRESTPASDATHESFWSEVRRLPRRQAQVVALFYGYDMSIAELANTLEISVGTAKTHLHRARQTLGERLSVDAEDGEDV